MEYTARRSVCGALRDPSEMSKVYFWGGIGPGLKGFAIGQLPFELGCSNMKIGPKSHCNCSKEIV